MSQQEIMQVAKGIALAFGAYYKDHRFTAKVVDGEVWVLLFGRLLVVKVDERIATMWLNDEQPEPGGIPE